MNYLNGMHFLINNRHRVDCYINYIEACILFNPDEFPSGSISNFYQESQFSFLTSGASENSMVLRNTPCILCPSLILPKRVFELSLVLWNKVKNEGDTDHSYYLNIAVDQNKEIKFTSCCCWELLFILSENIAVVVIALFVEP